MAFKKTAPTTQVPDSPDKLFRMLSRRRIPDVLPHQSAMMQAYVKQALDAHDVALQLPTGSGKTLVGLLIAEWKRRNKGEKVVYLCPTRQLVNQVVDQANDKYGLTVLGFTGRKRDYDPVAKAQYRTADHVAVTTYSSLFNTLPFFDDADTLIIDDAHTAEAYVAGAWSLSIELRNPEHATTFVALTNVLARFLSTTSLARLQGQSDSPDDQAWVDKISTPDLAGIAEELRGLLDANTDDTDIHFPWTLLRDHLEACHVYVSASRILIRPLIPPTWTHSAFTSPKQRIYMSATLGVGGDLERLFGRRRIQRLPISEGWDRQGVGRRFFIFPSLSLKEDELSTLNVRLMQAAGRSLVLVPSDAAASSVTEQLRVPLGYPTFDANAIGISKHAFIGQPRAVAIVANRYDGIDFPGDDCRLLVVQGLPKAMNLQERFLMSRMGANVLFNERIQTRVLQAIGRCTRSLEDYSAVVVEGADLPDYLVDMKRRKFLHPELQAELAFGIDQSKSTRIDGIVDNFTIFLNDRTKWEEAEQQIVAYRQAASQQPFPAINDLESVVSSEVQYQEEMWKADYEAAFGFARAVIGGLKDESLRGYRASWHYLAGSAAWLAFQRGSKGFDALAREQFRAAKKAASAVPWLSQLATLHAESTESSDSGSIVASTMLQIERVEVVLEKLGTLHDAKYSLEEKGIIDDLGQNDSKRFEEGQRRLGELLGFSSGNAESDAAPDPWWFIDKQGLVFEDHSDAFVTSSLDAKKARQVALHPKWLLQNIGNAKDVTFLPVLVTPVKSVIGGAVGFLDGVALWPLDDFRQWASNTLAQLRTLRGTFREPGDLMWRALAYEVFENHKISISSLVTFLEKFPAKDLLRSTSQETK